MITCLTIHITVTGYNNILHPPPPLHHPFQGTQITGNGLLEIIGKCSQLSWVRNNQNIEIIETFKHSKYWHFETLKILKHWKHKFAIWNYPPRWSTALSTATQISRSSSLERRCLISFRKDILSCRFCTNRYQSLCLWQYMKHTLEIQFRPSTMNSNKR